MRRSLCLLSTAVLLTSGCAGTGPAATAERPPQSNATFNSGSENYEVRIRPDNPVLTRVVRGSTSQVWTVLPVIYHALGIEAEVVDEASLTIGTNRVSTNRIDGKHLSAFLRCGQDGAGPSAMSGRRYRMTVSSVLTAAEAGTTLTTRVEGYTTPADGSSGGPSYCASTGVLEQRIIDMVSARIPR